MNTVKLLVPHTDINTVMKDVRQSGVKYYPIRRLFGTYRIELDDHPVVSYLILKYSLGTVD